MIVVSEDSWNFPEFPLKLSNSDVHVWRTKLERPILQVRQLTQILSEKERMRANRYHFERDRNRFIIGRSVLRTILGDYLSTKPSKIQFHYGPYSKPYLNYFYKGDSHTIEFSTAHSHELALYVFAKCRRVGIDLEFIRNIPEAEQIAGRFFSERENKMLKKLPKSQKQEAFFKYWTSKEAFIKATEKPLDIFDASQVPAYWSIKSFKPVLKYIASLVVEGHNYRLIFFQF